MDVSAPGDATVSVKLPPKAPAVRIRTARTHLLQGAAHPRARRVPAHGDRPLPHRRAPARRRQAAGYGFARVKRRATGRIVVRANGVTGRTKAQVVVTVRDRSRRATVVKRTILILPLDDRVRPRRRRTPSRAGR